MEYNEKFKQAYIHKFGVPFSDQYATKMNSKSEIEKLEAEVRQLQTCLEKTKFQLEFLKSHNNKNSGLVPIPKPRIARKPTNPPLSNPLFSNTSFSKPSASKPSISKHSVVSKPLLRSTTPSADSGGGGSEPLSSENSPNFIVSRNVPRNEILRNESQRLVRLNNVESDSDEDGNRKFYSSEEENKPTQPPIHKISVRRSESNRVVKAFNSNLSHSTCSGLKLQFGENSQSPDKQIENDRQQQLHHLTQHPNSKPSVNSSSSRAEWNYTNSKFQGDRAFFEKDCNFQKDTLLNDELQLEIKNTNKPQNNNNISSQHCRDNAGITPGGYGLRSQSCTIQNSDQGLAKHKNFDNPLNSKSGSDSDKQSSENKSVSDKTLSTLEHTSKVIPITPERKPSPLKTQYSRPAPKNPVNKENPTEIISNNIQNSSDNNQTSSDSSQHNNNSQLNKIHLNQQKINNSSRNTNSDFKNSFTHRTTKTSLVNSNSFSSSFSSKTHLIKTNTFSAGSISGVSNMASHFGSHITESTGISISPPNIQIDHRNIKTEEEVLQTQRRFQMLSCILDEEVKYHEQLTEFFRKLQAIEKSVKTAKPAMSNADYKTLSLKFAEIHRISNQFKRDLQKKLESFKPELEVWEVFMQLHRNFYHYKEYSENLPKAREVALKLEKEIRKQKSKSEEQKLLVESLLMTSVGGANYTLEQVLYQPIQSQTQFLQNVQQLLLNTPHHHADYDRLRMIIGKTMEDLSHGNSNYDKKRTAKIRGKNYSDSDWVSEKSAVMVEMRSGKRKMCHVILFPNCIACIKYEENDTGGDKIKNISKIKERDIRWIFPLNEVKVEIEQEGSIEPGVNQEKLDEWRTEIMKYRRLMQEANTTIQTHSGKGKEAKKAQKLMAESHKHIFRIQSDIILNAPCLGIRFSVNRDDSKDGVSDKLLLTPSDYEREDWIAAIKSSRHEFYKRPNGFKHFNVCNQDYPKIIAAAMETRRVAIGAAMATEGNFSQKAGRKTSSLSGLQNSGSSAQSLNTTSLSPSSSAKHFSQHPLTGVLVCTLYRATGFYAACTPAVTIEADIFGHFETRARTGPAESASRAPLWRDATFEIELDGSRNLNILLYEPKHLTPRELAVSNDPSMEILVAKGQINLLELPLIRNRDPVRKKFNLSDSIQIEISLEFLPRETLLRRTQSRKRNGIFGKPLESLSRKTGSKNGHFENIEIHYVPEIVYKCLSEVERRGLRIQGIYRQNGPAQKLSHIRSLFETGKKSEANRQLSTVDIHCVTGLLKLFFRQLPKPLFTDDLYREFIKSITCANDVEKHRSMQACLKKLPKVNFLTLGKLVDHFQNVKMYESDNKMNSYNLATVFGPTLLWPAESDRADIQMMTDVHYQNEIIMFCIENPQLFPKDPEISSDDNVLTEITESTEQIETTVNYGTDNRKTENSVHSETVEHLNLESNTESNSNLTQVTDEGQYSASSGSNSAQATPPAQSKSQFQTPPGVNPAAQSALGPPTYKLSGMNLRSRNSIKKIDISGPSLTTSDTGHETEERATSSDKQSTPSPVPIRRNNAIN